MSGRWWLHMVGGLITCVAVLATPVHAQESGDAGIVMGFPASIGALWHVTERVAIRPAIDFEVFSSEFDSDSSLETETSGWALGFSLGALVYLQNEDRLRTYVVPEVSYVWSGTDIDVEGLPIPAGSPVLDRSGDTWALSGLFGAQYALSDRFSMFGEVGLSYSTSSTSDEDDVLGELSTRRFGTRGAVGAILYF